MQQSMQKRTQQVTLLLGDNGQQYCVRLHGALDFLVFSEKRKKTVGLVVRPCWCGYPFLGWLGYLILLQEW